MAVSPVVIPLRTRERIDGWKGGLMAFLFAILTAFILYPVLSVMWIALSDEAGNLTVIHFLNFFRRPLFREALWNTQPSGITDSGFFPFI